jgi:hypothetical protein
MRAMVGVLVLAMLLATTPARAQDVSGAPAASAPGEAAGGAPGGSRGKGHRGSGQNTAAQKPKVDDKAYRSALDRMSDQKYDPWRDLR